jgi:glycerol uptake facilitator protein
MASARTATPVKPSAATKIADVATVRRLCAEGLGTAFLTLIGCGAVTVTESLNTAAKRSLSFSDLGFIALAFGLALAIAVYAVGKVSGAHVNPAVTIGMLVSRRIDPVMAVLYIVAQLVGAVVAGYALIAIYGTAIAKSTSMGVTSFAAPTTAVQAAVVEAIATFIFLFVITAMAADSRAPSGWTGLIIGLTLAAAIMVTGTVTGGSLNPARSFGPELVKMLYGGKPDWAQYWVYVVGPVVGAIAGVFAYDFVSNNRSK